MREFVISLRKGKSLADLPDRVGSLRDFLASEEIAITTVMPTGTTVVARLSDRACTRFLQRYGNAMHVVERVKGHVL
jgi:hypothetical protein